MNLLDFKGKTWSQACETLKSWTLLVACTDDSRLTDVAKLIRDHGEHAGAAYISALLYVEEHGASNAISLGIFLYRQFAEKNGLSELQKKILTMEDYTIWGCPSWHSVPNFHKKVSMMPPKKKLHRHAGYMNFLLHEGSKKLGLSATTDVLVCTGVRDFLNWIFLPRNSFHELRKKERKTKIANVSSISMCKKIGPST